MRITSVTISDGFPLQSGETIRIHYAGSRRETRVKIGTGLPSEGKTTTFSARSYTHNIGTNKESISLVGNERKLRRV